MSRVGGHAFQPMWQENIQIGGRFQQDDERGSQGFWSHFPPSFGNKKLSPQAKGCVRLDESPERDIDIVTGDVVTDQGNRVPVLKQRDRCTTKSFDRWQYRSWWRQRIDRQSI